MKLDVSVPRNPVLAKMFRIAKFCENAGYGFDKMLVWKKETNKDVIFETFFDSTKVTFMLKESKEEFLGGTENDTEKGTEKHTETTENDSEKAQERHRKGTEKGTEKLTNNQQKIIDNISKKPYITSEELSVIVGIRADKIRVNLTKLKTKGIIRREGGDKGGKWIIIVND